MIETREKKKKKKKKRLDCAVFSMFC